MPHAPAEDCTCRKPAPGLLEQICERYGVDAEDVQVVGKTAWMHLQAGAALGARLHLVCTGASAHLAPGLPLPAGGLKGCACMPTCRRLPSTCGTRTSRGGRALAAGLTRRAPMTQRFVQLVLDLLVPTVAPEFDKNAFRDYGSSAECSCFQ